MCQTMCIPSESRDKMDAYLKIVRLNKGFKQFVNECRRLNIELIVNSDGYDYAIKAVLRRYGLSNLKVYCNQLIPLGRAHFLYFPHGNLKCTDSQGTCKCELVAHAVKQQRGVIVIGNDRTDRCVTQFADFVFADFPRVNIKTKMTW